MFFATRSGRCCKPSVSGTLCRIMRWQRARMHESMCLCSVGREILSMATTPSARDHTCALECLGSTWKVHGSANAPVQRALVVPSDVDEDRAAAHSREGRASLSSRRPKNYSHRIPADFSSHSLATARDAHAGRHGHDCIDSTLQNEAAAVAEARDRRRRPRCPRRIAPAGRHEHNDLSPIWLRRPVLRPQQDARLAVEREVHILLRDADGTPHDSLSHGGRPRALRRGLAARRRGAPSIDGHALLRVLRRHVDEA